ncbi:VOC family protein [soil metagenome]
MNVMNRMSRAPVRSGVPAPYLRVSDADAAIAFYVRIFGAVEVVRLREPGGRTAHAELRLGEEGSLMLSSEYPEYDLRGPLERGGTSVAIQLYVDDVDGVFAAAEEAGARVVKPPALDPFGDRLGKFVDPWGHEWLVGARVETIDAPEMERRFAAMFGGPDA